ncbi:uncharacterized protein LOC113596755 [Acinonyx jubatus]|uniref:Uncharacterized protein LOC113596755 n=1 Tax=Acinonyx jubatus TaxID=32536 RepID=A0ABM3PQ19_ACIJB|nr:uncharacterized protein LOC113596755 [Acinonyx jubatus]XP_053073777.1 uncharacterized protein LOC113596755 [Acinonyx jubatus]XP_053073778.1 uncharacterized protein LOC113596755 [Acinonyx jubatus]XP_053073779.1 uncharacterized protein LOC113596755 [Acinonyx jubatus]
MRNGTTTAQTSGWSPRKQPPHTSPPASPAGFCGLPAPLAALPGLPVGGHLCLASPRPDSGLRWGPRHHRRPGPVTPRLFLIPVAFPPPFKMALGLHNPANGAKGTGQMSVYPSEEVALGLAEDGASTPEDKAGERALGNDSAAGKENPGNAPWFTLGSFQNCWKNPESFQEAARGAHNLPGSLAAACELFSPTPPLQVDWRVPVCPARRPWKGPTCEALEAFYLQKTK